MLNKEKGDSISQSVISQNLASAETQPKMHSLKRSAFSKWLLTCLAILFKVVPHDGLPLLRCHHHVGGFTKLFQIVAVSVLTIPEFLQKRHKVRHDCLWTFHEWKIMKYRYTAAADFIFRTSECFGTTKRISKKQEDRIRNLRAPILLPFYWRRVMLSQERDKGEAGQRHRKWRHYLGWIMSFTSSVSCFS